MEGAEVRFPGPSQKVWIRIRVDEAVLAKMVELHIRPSEVFMRNVRSEIQKRERKRKKAKAESRRKLNPYLPLVYQES